eukprot:TRINITY_DN567_c0_g1_i2.p1 TRINITY_DN567_c0_g1~~TRINITY_DN567_c0_g1_i2.p1  ORF type:complete len:354 (-),score=118.98 TRINITY_DN567_c0_g1_i2:55-1116(-)
MRMLPPGPFTGNGSSGINAEYGVPGTNNSDQRRVSGASVGGVVENDVYAQVTITASLTPWVTSLTQVVRLYKTAKLIEFVNTMSKMATVTKEGVYFAFPVNVPGGNIRMEMTGGLMSVEADQLPGACRDWFAVQDVIGVTSPAYSVFLSSPDAPLFVVEEINVLTFQTHLDLVNTHLFSYIMNNYWDTNYKASQGGDFTFRYVMGSAAGLAADATILKFGTLAAAPTVAMLVPTAATAPATARGTQEGAISFIDVVEATADTSCKCAQMLGVKTGEAGAGVVAVRLQEVCGLAAGSARVRVAAELGPVVAAQRTDLLERNGVALAVTRDATTGDSLVAVPFTSRQLVTLLLFF